MRHIRGVSATPARAFVEEVGAVISLLRSILALFAEAQEVFGARLPDKGRNSA